MPLYCFQINAVQTLVKLDCFGLCCLHSSNRTDFQKSLTDQTKLCKRNIVGLLGYLLRHLEKVFPKGLETFLSNSTWSMNLLCLWRHNKIIAKRKNPNVHNLMLLDTEQYNCIFGVAVLLATYLLNGIFKNSCWTIYRK